ncbi:MAG: proton-conducting transporter membrane subunit [Parvularculales bacterium]
MTVALWLTLGIPLGAAVFIGLTGRHPNVREAITLFAACALFATVLWLLNAGAAETRASLVLVTLTPDFALRFSVEPLGMLFAVVASGLWIVNSLYSIGYMRGTHETHQTRFYICFAIAIGSAMGIAFAADMLTLFLFYETLTLSTWPLVTHKGTEEARKGGRTYLILLLGTSICFQLVAIIWTWLITGTLNFTNGGILHDSIDGPFVALLLGLYAFGIGKAALMPFHRWLPSAMVAPTPVSALLHAVAVVKAGVFTILKVGVYIFGLEFLQQTGASQWLIWVACASILIASLIALTKNNLKARLAYSTVSQLAYVTLGMALASPLAVLGAAMQIAMHAMGKITLFMSAGAIYVASHENEVDKLAGLGRVMPFTFAAFFIGALSVTGIPPLGGALVKWRLLEGAAEGYHIVVILVLVISSVLNAAYLIMPVARAFFMPAPEKLQTSGIKEAPLFCVVPLCLTALGCFALFFYAHDIETFLAPILIPETVPQ